MRFEAGEFCGRRFAPEGAPVNLRDGGAWCGFFAHQAVNDAAPCGEEVVQERAVHELKGLAHGRLAGAFTFRGEEARRLAEGGEELIDVLPTFTAAAFG